MGLHLASDLSPAVSPGLNSKDSPVINDLQELNTSFASLLVILNCELLLTLRRDKRLCRGIYLWYLGELDNPQ